MTIHHDFNIKKILESAWDKTKEHLVFLISLLLCAFVIMILAAFIPLINIIVPLLIGIAFIKISLLIVSGTKPTKSHVIDSLKKYKVAWKFFLATLVYMLIPFITVILYYTTVLLVISNVPVLLSVMAIPLFFLTVFLIPTSVYLIIRLQFYKFLVVENENIGVLEAFKQSMLITRGNFWKILAFMIVLVAMNVLGKLALGIGLLITVPISLLANAILYKELLPTEKKEVVKEKEEKKKTK